MFYSIDNIWNLLFAFIGKAVKQTTDGECEERSYVNGVLDGEATVIFPDGSKEIRTYKVLPSKLVHSDQLGFNFVATLEYYYNHSL